VLINFGRRARRDDLTIDAARARSRSLCARIDSTSSRATATSRDFSLHSRAASCARNACPTAKIAAKHATVEIT